MPTPERRSSRPRHARGSVLRRRRLAEGQSLVEFALILVPLLLILMGILQFGFIFQSYVTLSSAARDAARTASIYLYDMQRTRAENDLLRNNLARSSLLASFNGLRAASPNFTSGTTWATSSSSGSVTAANGDITVTYTLPSGVTDNDPRAGWRMTVRASYHLDIIVPLIGALLPRDANGRFVIPAEVTMVIN